MVKDMEPLISVSFRSPSFSTLSYIFQGYGKTTILYCISLMLFKTSILLEWLRIFVPRAVRNTFFWTCHVMIWVNAALYIATVMVIVLGCNPREKSWKPWVEGTCVNINAVNTFIAGFNLFLDIGILILPYRVIWTLQLSMRQKIGVSFIFSVGVMYVPHLNHDFFDSDSYSSFQTDLLVMVEVAAFALPAESSPR